MKKEEIKPTPKIIAVLLAVVTVVTVMSASIGASKVIAIDNNDAAHIGTNSSEDLNKDAVNAINTKHNELVEAERQAELARQAEAARQAELARQEAARQAEIARQKEIARQEALKKQTSYKTPSGALSKSKGVVYFNGHRETYYSQRVLPGNSLRIPGRHIGEDGTIRDANNYICVASSDLPKGTIVETSLGTGKVYDCGCPHGTIDVYVNW